jgi:hypothetical protein
MLPRNYTAYEFTYSESIDKITSIIHNTIHNINEELPRFQVDYVNINQSLRVKYLENSITEEEFKIVIQRNDKKNKKNIEIAQVIQLANTAVSDIVHRLLDFLKKAPKTIDDNSIMPHLSEIQEIIKYCNDIFKDISFTYKTVLYSFDDLLRFKKIEKEHKSNGKKKAYAPGDTSQEISDDDY